MRWAVATSSRVSSAGTAEQEPQCSSGLLERLARDHARWSHAGSLCKELLEARGVRDRHRRRGGSSPRRSLLQESPHPARRRGGSRPRCSHLREIPHPARRRGGSRPRCSHLQEIPHPARRRGGSRPRRSLLQEIPHPARRRGRRRGSRNRRPD